MRRFFLGVSLCATLSALIAANAVAANYTFADIANSSEAFLNFQPPVINNAGEVATLGQRESGAGQGLLFRTGGSGRVEMADDRKLDTNIGRFAMNDHGVVAFESNFGRLGLFSTAGAGLTTIADPTSGYSVFGKPAINNHGFVAAPAHATQDDIIGGSGGGPPQPLAHAPGSLTYVAFDINDAGQAVFISNTHNDLQQGLFLADASGVHTIAETTSGWSAPFSYVAINDSGTVAFTGTSTAYGSGVYVWSEDTGVQPFAIGRLGAVSINNSGDIAMSGLFLDPSMGEFVTAILLRGESTENVVVRVGGALFGSTITQILVEGPFLNDADQIAFYYVLADGRFGIARADPIPEPAMLIWLVAALAVLLMKRYRSHILYGSRVKSNAH